MPDQANAGGAVSRDDLTRLALDFDRFEYALDPQRTEAKEAEERVEREVPRLYQEHVERKGLDLIC